MDGKVDAFVAGVGAAARCRRGRFLKERNPGVRIVAVEPRIPRLFLERAGLQSNPGNRRRLHPAPCWTYP